MYATSITIVHKIKQHIQSIKNSQQQRACCDFDQESTYANTIQCITKDQVWCLFYLKNKDPIRVFVPEAPRNLSKTEENPKNKLQNCSNLELGDEKFRELTCKASRNFCRSRGICWCANRRQGPLSSSRSTPTFWRCSLRHQLLL